MGLIEQNLNGHRSVDESVHSKNVWIPGAKDHRFHACMKKYDFETRKTWESSPNRADFECFQDYESIKWGVIRKYQKDKIPFATISYVYYIKSMKYVGILLWKNMYCLYKPNKKKS